MEKLHEDELPIDAIPESKWALFYIVVDKINWVNFEILDLWRFERHGDCRHSNSLIHELPLFTLEWAISKTC